MLLLATDERYPKGAHRSALEVATEDAKFACKRLLEHRHCKSIVVEVFEGFEVVPPPEGVGAALVMDPGETRHAPHADSIAHCPLGPRQRHSRRCVWACGY